MSKQPINAVPYDDLRDQIRTGDLLLWRPTSLMGRAICVGSSLRRWRRIRHSHASMAAWGPGDRLYNLEMIQRIGGRHRRLSGEVWRYKGSCEVWRPRNPDYDGEGAANMMLWLMGQHYGWRNFMHIVARAVMPHIIMPHTQNTDDPDQPLVCSAAFAWSARMGGGVEVCPGTVDREVTPAALALSGFAEYFATPI